MAYCANTRCNNIVKKVGAYCDECEANGEGSNDVCITRTDGLRFTRDQRQKLENEHRRREQEEE